MASVPKPTSAPKAGNPSVPFNGVVNGRNSGGQGGSNPGAK